MCAALNVCGWAHAVHTADVDALLFGALTVYSKMHLQAGHLAGSRQPHMLHIQLAQAQPGSSCDRSQSQQGATQPVHPARPTTMPWPAVLCCADGRPQALQAEALLHV